MEEAVRRHGRGRDQPAERAWRYRTGRLEIAVPNDTWAMDFMFGGLPIRLLTVRTGALS